MRQELENNETPHALGIKNMTTHIAGRFLATVQTLPMPTCTSYVAMTVLSDAAVTGPSTCSMRYRY